MTKRALGYLFLNISDWGAQDSSRKVGPEVASQTANLLCYSGEDKIQVGGDKNLASINKQRRKKNPCFHEQSPGKGKAREKLIHQKIGLRTGNSRRKTSGRYEMTDSRTKEGNGSRPGRGAEYRRRQLHRSSRAQNFKHPLRG